MHIIFTILNILPEYKSFTFIVNQLLLCCTYYTNATVNKQEKLSNSIKYCRLKSSYTKQ